MRKTAAEFFNSFVMAGIMQLNCGLVLNLNPIICKYTEIGREFPALI
jgi:hypothetical protein